MVIYKLLLLQFFCSLCIFAQAEKHSLPVQISTAVVYGREENVCPLQNKSNVLLIETKAHIRQVIRDFVKNLNQSNTSQGSNGTGWRRIAFMNITDSSDICPLNLTMYTSPVRGCGHRLYTTRGCDSVFFPLNSQSYSIVHGRIIAYQRGSPDAFANYHIYGQTTIDSAYVDGVSLTHGPAGSRQHIWTFGAAVYEANNIYLTRDTCNCTNSQYSWPHQLPPFVGNNYFCDTGNHGPGWDTTTYYSDDPLWDGKGCGPFSTCCQFNSPPWFQTTLPQTTSDDIELRVCRDEANNNEDTIINLIEIYVQ